MTPARLRQLWADLLASFWVRPVAMTIFAACLSETLVRIEGAVSLPSWIEAWIYAGGGAGARDVLGAIASATIGVAGTTFSITVAALSLASNQMGPRLLRNFTRDPGNQYSLGALLATFAYSLVALRSVYETDQHTFVPQIAVSVALLLAFGCIGVLIWFLHHVALSINVDRVVALVHGDLAEALRRVPETTDDPETSEAMPMPDGPRASLIAPDGGYLRVLDDTALADWAEEHDAWLELRTRPGNFVFPGSMIGEVLPASLRAEAQKAVTRCLSIGDSRSVEQDLEYAVRQLVEIGLRALSPGINDPMTAIAVLDRLGAALCELATRRLPSGVTVRDGKRRLARGATDYPGLVDAMFHMLRQAGSTIPAVMIRLLEVLAEAGAVERDRERILCLRLHADLARDAALRGTQDPAALDALHERHRTALDAMESPDAGNRLASTIH